MSKYEGESSELREEEKPPKKLKIKPVNTNTAINKGKEAAVEDDHQEISTNGVVQVKLFSCTICSKTFRSDKAVHGHMNTHPERPWRGIRQKNYSRPITANSDDDQKSGSDLMGVLSGGWPTDVRRGRTCGSAAAMAATSSSFIVDEDELVMGAAYGIMLIATGDDRYKILPPSNNNKIRISEIPSPRKNLEEGNKLDVDDLHMNLPPSKYDEIRVSAISPPSTKKPRICGYEDERKNQKLDENKLKMVTYMEGISSCGNGNTASLIGTKRKRMNNEVMETMIMNSYTCGTCRKSFATPQAYWGHKEDIGRCRNGNTISLVGMKKSKRMTNEAMESMMMKSYTCGTCGKSFATPQALGGHTSSSSHSSKIAVKSAGPEQVPIKDERGGSLDASHHLSSSSCSHVCKWCNKAFPSGQALGGHQRVHYNKPSSSSVVAKDNNNGVVDEDNDQNEVIRKPALCLDLNEIPADDSEEGD